MARAAFDTDASASSYVGLSACSIVLCFVALVLGLVPFLMKMPEECDANRGSDQAEEEDVLRVVLAVALPILIGALSGIGGGSCGVAGGRTRSKDLAITSSTFLGISGAAFIVAAVMAMWASHVFAALCVDAKDNRDGANCGDWICALESVMLGCQIVAMVAAIIVTSASSFGGVAGCCCPAFFGFEAASKQPVVATAVAVVGKSLEG